MPIFSRRDAETYEGPEEFMKSNFAEEFIKGCKSFGGTPVTEKLEDSFRCRMGDKTLTLSTQNAENGKVSAFFRSWGLSPTIRVSKVNEFRWDKDRLHVQGENGLVILDKELKPINELTVG